ncbi:hypothetical protein BGZ46_008126 [Entomortierella lignicola]|nr:hypothetical protein BGZ46_008126 [Entomortierella lignicola]
MPKLPFLTIYHNPSLQVSKEALKLLKRASNGQKFNIDLIQAKTIPPTKLQISTIIQYLGRDSVDDGVSLILVPDAPKASTIEQVQTTLDKNPELLRKPLIVDWINGRAIIADPPVKVNEFVLNFGNMVKPKTEKTEKTEIVEKAEKSQKTEKIGKAGIAGK